MTATAADVPLPEEHERKVPVVAIWTGMGALVVGLMGGFFIGRGTASSGPSSLADALNATANGSLPRGDVTGTIQQLGGIRALTGGTGTGGSGGTGTGGGRGVGGVAGTVSSVNANVITIATTAATVKVQVSASTTFSKTVAASETDVTPGERVTVRQDFSTPSSGGQVNAAAVVIVPATASTSSGSGG